MNIDIYKKMIDYYLKEMKINFECKKVTPAQYFEEYSIDEYILCKTSCMYAYNGQYLKFILNRAFELGYLNNQDDDILEQVDIDLRHLIDNNTFESNTYYDNTVITNSSNLD